METCTAMPLKKLISITFFLDQKKKIAIRVGYITVSSYLEMQC